MMNQIVIVGRISAFTDKKLLDKNVKELVVACPRSYKNENGEYDTDFIPVILSGNIAENTLEYCKTGDVIGVKGSVRTLESEDGKHPFYLQAEKVTFLSSSKITDDKEEE